MSDFKVSEELRTHYDGYYRDGDSEWRRIGALDKAKNIQAITDGLEIKLVIEIGAGEGSVLKRLSELNFGEVLYGLEISTSGVEVIEEKKIPRLLECQKFDGYNTPHTDNKFDLAILSHVIEHVEHPRQLIYEAARIAKYVFIEVPLEDSVRLSNDYVEDDLGHINFYSPKTIRRLMQTCGLRVLEQRVINRSLEGYKHQSGRRGIISYYVKNILLWLSPCIATKIFTYHSALICERNEINEDKVE